MKIFAMTAYTLELATLFCDFLLFLICFLIPMVGLEEIYNCEYYTYADRKLLHKIFVELERVLLAR